MLAGQPTAFHSTPDPNRRQQYRRNDDRKLLQRERELDAARRICLALFQHFDVKELIKKALQTALDVVGADGGSVLLADPESRQLVFRHSIGASPVKNGTAIPWDQGIAGAVFTSGAPDVIADVKQDPRHFPGIDEMTGYKTRDMIALPLKRWEGEPIGALTIVNKRGGPLDKDDLALLTIVSAVTAIAIEESRLFEAAKLAEVACLLGDIGHDIKNLLQPVVSGAGLLQRELEEHFDSLPNVDMHKAKESRELCKEVIAIQRDTTRRMHDRMKDIADCVKGLLTPPKFAPCRLADVANQVVKTLGVLAAEKKIALRVENLDVLPSIDADESRLFNAFYNLVNNAIPEVPEGGSIIIRGQVKPEAGVVLLDVADTGRGMPPEIRENLFTINTPSRKTGGTGLGTKIVKDVVEAHGGLITVESAEGVGTTFRVTLPIQQHSPAAQ